MTDIPPGWYRDPAEPTTQRYWDGQGWLGTPVPADAEPPARPPAAVAERARVASAARPDPGPGTPARAAPAGRRPGLSLPELLSLPRQPPPGFVLASPGARLAARLVDLVAVLILGAIANAWFAIHWWQSFYPYLMQVYRLDPAATNNQDLPQPPEDATTLLLMILVVTTAVWFAYEVPDNANSGQTLGKRLLGIKVMRLESTQRLGFGRAWRRWSRLGLPTLVWSCCGIGFVLQFVDCLFVAVDRPLHQALHDKAAATVVVRVARNRPS